jgi:hypothetical protein
VCYGIVGMHLAPSSLLSTLPRERHLARRRSTIEGAINPQPLKRHASRIVAAQ